MPSPLLRNPFLDTKADHTESLPPGDVPELHHEIYERQRAAVANARQIGQGFGLLVVGEAGSGKSHLIGRLRQHLDADPNAVLVTLRLRTGRIGHLWRPVRQQLFEELLRPFHHKAAGANGLLRLLGNRFPEWAAAARGGPGGLLDWLIGRRRQADLKPHLDEFARACPLHHDLLKVLPQLANPDLAGLADQWLRGSQPGEEDLKRLGLAPVFPGDREREDIASEVVLSFLRLAGEKTTLVLCFDEVEAIQAGNWDRPVLREFATMAVTMLGVPGPRVVMTSLRFNLHTDLRQAADVTSMQKLATQGPVFIKMLEWEQMLRIVHARLDAEPTCRAERLLHPPGSDWPLGRKFLEELHQKHRRILTPRHVLQACSEEFARLQAGTPPADPDPMITIEVIRPDGPPPPTVSGALRKQLAKAWEDHAARFKKCPQGVKFDNVLEIVLPWLAHLLDLPFSRSEGKHPGIADVNLVFFSRIKGQKSLGMSLCNDPPTNLWRRLDRLKKQWQANKGKTLAALHLLRFADERTTDTSRERITGLEAEGVSIQWLPTQQLAELAAYQAMLADVQNGDLTRPGGKPVGRQEYDDWVKDHLPETHSVKELLDALFGAAPAPVAPAELVAAGKGGRA